MTARFEGGVASLLTSAITMITDLEQDNAQLRRTLATVRNHLQEDNDGVTAPVMIEGINTALRGHEGSSC